MLAALLAANNNPIAAVIFSMSLPVLYSVKHSLTPVLVVLTACVAGQVLFV